MSYDARGNMLTRTAPAPLSYQESYSYDARNNVTSFTDARGKTTNLAYDLAGNVASVTAGSTSTPPPGVAFRAAATRTASATTIAINEPAGTAQNDLMLAELAVNNMTTATITPPSGWTLLERRNLSYDSQAYFVYYKLAGSGEPAAYTWTFSAAKNMSGGIASFSGVDTASPVNQFGSQQNTSVASFSTPRSPRARTTA
jgi:YD repeat-containing protein